MDFTFLKEKQAKDLRGSRIKLVAMLAILVLIIAAVIKYPPRRTIPKEGDPVGTEVVKEDAKGILGPAEGKAPPVIQATPKEGVEPAAIPPATVLQQIHDQHSDLEPAPFFYMLHRVSQDQYEELKAQAKKGLDWNTLWDRPASLRGEPVEIRGTLIRSWRQGLAKNPLNLSEVWGYRIRAEGAPRESQGYIFDVYSIEKLYGALPYDHMVTYGRFLKARTLEPDHYVDPEFHAAVVVTPRFEPLTYLDAPEPPQPIVQEGRPEARAIYYLLKRAETVPFLELKATALKGLSLVDFTNHADRYLGKPVLLRGELLRCQRTALSENPLHLDAAYYGQIVDIDHTMNTFYCLNIPEGLRLKDEVVLYGFFLKRWTYTSQGEREITSPIFVAQCIVKVLVSQDRTLVVVLVAMFTLIALLLVIAHFRARGQQLVDAEARRQRDIERAPKNLNEVARRILTDLHGEDPSPKPQDPPPQPPAPEQKP